MFLCAVCTSAHSRYVDVVNSLTLIITHFLHNFQTLKKKKIISVTASPLPKNFFIFSLLSPTFFSTTSLNPIDND